MKAPLLKIPSLGTLHGTGYFILLGLLMLGGVNVTLNALFFITMAVPVVGTWQREPKARWRVAAALCILCSLAFLLIRHLQADAQPWLFYMATNNFGFESPCFDALNLLVVGSIFLPLSAACAFERVIRLRGQRQ